MQVLLTSGVQRSGDARADCLIGCPLPKPNIERWRMVVIVTVYTLFFVTSQYDVIFRFATNVLAKFVDTTCVFRGTGATLGQGGAVKQLRAIGTYKKQKNRYQLCLFLFISNVDLKNNNRNYKKSF